LTIILSAARGCTHCIEVGKRCTDCEEHLDQELILVVPQDKGSAQIIITGFQHYLAAVNRHPTPVVPSVLHKVPPRPPVEPVALPAPRVPKPPAPGSFDEWKRKRAVEIPL
jgi:hypothetical protein